jgi:hypothetical protein
VRGGGGGDTFDAATTNSNDALAKMTAGLVALQASSSSAAAAAAAATENNSTTTTEEYNKLQLLFASSRNTSLVHCIDVTVRCTPMNPLLSSLGSGGGEAHYWVNFYNKMIRDGGDVNSNNVITRSTSTVFYD